MFKIELTTILKFKYLFHLTLFFALAVVISNSANAQPGEYLDSLITLKKEFKVNEKIEFTVKLHNQSKRKPYNVRMVPTMSCSCGDKDFYYELYSVIDVKKPYNRKAFLIHNERADAKRCDCKFRHAEFYDEKQYFIPAINQAGKYLLVIQGSGFVMYSNIFEVSN